MNINTHDSFSYEDLHMNSDIFKSTIVKIDQELELNDILPGCTIDEPTALLLDINNLYRRARENGYRINYGELKNIFSARCNLQYAGIYTAVDRDDSKAENWISYMKNNGYDVIEKDLKKIFVDEEVVFKKGNMDVEITIGALSLPEGYTHVILGTCDSDFVPLIKKLKNDRHITVSVLGMGDVDGIGMSSSLLKAADNYYDMNKLYKIGRFPEYVFYPKD